MSAIHPWYQPDPTHEDRDPQWGSVWVMAALLAGLLVALWQ